MRYKISKFMHLILCKENNFKCDLQIQYSDSVTHFAKIRQYIYFCILQLNISYT